MTGEMLQADDGAIVIDLQAYDGPSKGDQA
jgi:hypothetical protein